jgi:hypothetical protein
MALNLAIRSLSAPLVVGLFAWFPSFAGPTPPNPTAGYCGPTYAEIYDFQAGEIFQDIQTHTAGGAEQTAYTVVRKYRIASREAIPGGIRYRIEGLAKSYTQGLFLPIPPNTRYTRVDTTWEFADSAAGETLGACENAIVRVPALGPFYTPANRPYTSANRPLMIPPNSDPLPLNYTRVILAKDDSVDFRLAKHTGVLKILGGPSAGNPKGNLYSDSALKREATDHLIAVYAAGLGMVRFSGWQFETAFDAELSGYCRGRDTVGTLSPDTAFEAPVAVFPEAAATRSSRDALDPDPPGSVLLSAKGRGMTDLLGRRARSFPDLKAP